MKKVIKALVMLGLLALLAAMIFSGSPSNEEQIRQQIAQHGFRPRESFMGDGDDSGPDAPYLTMTYGNSLGEEGSHWLLMVFPSEKYGKAFNAQTMELALFAKGEEAPRVFTYSSEELAAALTWNSEAEHLSLAKRNELWMSRVLTVGASAAKREGKTRFEPHDMATLMICVPWDDALEGMGISIWGEDDQGVTREYHNYLTLPADGGSLF